MIDEFASPKQLIAHAHDEINEAERLIADFVREQQHSPVIYTDDTTGQQIHRIKIIGPSLPSKVANIVKDAAGNLRDALDHAVYSAAVVISGGNPAKTGFPFAKDAAGVMGELAGKRLIGNPPEIRPILASFSPYEGGE